jgi:hypothetical protein
MGMQIALVYVDDWQGLYVNEALVYQDPRITIAEVMNYVLYNHVDRFEQIEASYAHMAMIGAFPQALREVVLQDGRTMQERWDSE